MRGRATISRELERAEAQAAAPLGDSYDNDGNLAATGAARQASYARHAARLRRELADLDRVLGDRMVGQSADLRHVEEL